MVLLSLLAADVSEAADVCAGGCVSCLLVLILIFLVKGFEVTNYGGRSNVERKKRVSYKPDHKLMCFYSLITVVTL